MSLTGKGTLSLRKKDVQQQKQAGSTYRRLVFAHKANAGETGVTFTGLIQPSEMAALGFVNPSSADILAANILFYKKNLSVISSARGVLIQDLSYTVTTSSKITFQGFTALQDEIFTFVLETGVRDGQTIVDASPIVATGTLAVGVTDFNVGTPFEVNKYSNQQVGSVLVFRNGVIQFRNTGNSSSNLDGNYYEVNNGSGLATVIRFNVAPNVQEDNIVVWGNLLAERPDGSMMAAIESLAGQLDKMIPTLAILAGVPQSTFQGAPNNQDLKTFGNTVLDHENRIDALEIPTYIEGTITIPAQSGAADTYVDVAGSIINLPTGKWELIFNGNVYCENTSGGILSVIGNIAITDLANSIQDNALATVGYSAIANSQGTYDAVTLIARVSGGSYKLRLRSNQNSASGKIVIYTSATGGLTDPDALFKWYARKVGV